MCCRPSVNAAFTRRRWRVRVVAQWDGAPPPPPPPSATRWIWLPGRNNAATARTVSPSSGFHQAPSRAQAQALRCRPAAAATAMAPLDCCCNNETSAGHLFAAAGVRLRLLLQRRRLTGWPVPQVLLLAQLPLLLTQRQRCLQPHPRLVAALAAQQRRRQQGPHPCSAVMIARHPPSSPPSPRPLARARARARQCLAAHQPPPLLPCPQRVAHSPPWSVVAPPPPPRPRCLACVAPPLLGPSTYPQDPQPTCSCRTWGTSPDSSSQQGTSSRRRCLHACGSRIHDTPASASLAPLREKYRGGSGGGAPCVDS
jgi:hypothetical protein